MIEELIYLGEEENQIPTLTTYILDGSESRPAVVICPGGGYGYTSPREAKPVALAFNRAGYHAFVVDYSVSPDRYPTALLDLSKAIDLIRKKTHDWHIETDLIAVCGFSAGGHLVASLGVYWKKIAKETLLNNQPNLLILCYPVISTGEFKHQGSFDNLLGNQINDALLKELSLENHVNSDTPPTFLWHTVEDQSVPVENSLLFAKALRKNDIPFELHVFPYGKHGLSLATKETAVSDDQINYQVSLWLGLCTEWLKVNFKT